MSCTPDEFKYGLLLAHYEPETALTLTLSDYSELVDEEGDLLPGAVDALLLFLPEATKDIRAACDDFNRKIAALQRRGFRVMQGGRQ